MDRRLVVVLPGTRDTSRNIVKHLRDLDIEFMIIPVIDVEIDHAEVESARRAFSSGFTPDISVFTSKTAVKIVRKIIPDAWKYAEMRSLAIGPGTASLLKRLGAENVEAPEKHSSEGLIEFLLKIQKNSSLSLYCSKHVNLQLEEFIKESFRSFHIFKLYTIRENRENLKKLIEHVDSFPGKLFIIVLTSLKVLKVLSDGKLLSAQNIVYSVMSRRLLSEALKLNLPIYHGFSASDVNLYYENLRSLIKKLLTSQND